MISQGCPRKLSSVCGFLIPLLCSPSSARPLRCSANSSMSGVPVTTVCPVPLANPCAHSSTCDTVVYQQLPVTAFLVPRNVKSFLPTSYYLTFRVTQICNGKQYIETNVWGYMELQVQGLPTHFIRYISPKCWSVNHVYQHLSDSFLPFG